MTRCSKIFLVVLLSLFCIRSEAQNISDSITPQQLKEYVSFLAADSMRGRSNGSRELEICAAYIANEFEKFGLKKSVVLQSYFQRFHSKPDERLPSFSPDLNEKSLVNVVGILPGKSKPDEVVVFSAHYDHLGVDSNLRKDKIYNGANDNASGTAAVLALAKYFSLRNDNERTLVFCAFAGEEFGLKGSDLFVNGADLNGIKAVINIEMIGRPDVGRNAFFITGSDYSNFSSIISKNLPRRWVKIVREPPEYKQLYQRSDNYPFVQKKLVAHSIMSSDDDDACYHKPCDETDRIDFNSMTEIVKAIVVGCRTIISGEDTPRSY